MVPQSPPTMSETVSLNEGNVHFEASNDGGRSSGGTSEGFHDNDDFSGDRGAAPIAEHSGFQSINPAATSLNEGEQSAGVKGKQSDEMIENLVTLFRDFLEAAPNPAIHTHTQRNAPAGRKRFFGLTKGSLPENSSYNRDDYEHKYPRDRFGEEASDNARVWLTYLDEAEAFDRERVEGWKETVDVLLIFAGLFSGVITTFVSQASQTLQQDNTQVSASLLFEIAQLLRAQSSGIPSSHVPKSTLTPTSLFTPSTNAFLVNGLWFTSLAITLSTALFAVLAKQWLYYYLSSINGTAHEKARARQLRFKGFELWKVGAIVDLLPILLHLAVGVFLTGIIILLFPLDIRVAWTIVIITGITYLLYFISVILPIRYPECPYTTSLTIYIGVLVFSLRTILRRMSRTSGKWFQAVWRRINFKARYTIRRLFDWTKSLFRYALIFILELVGFMRRGFDMLGDILFTEEFPKFTKWREENIKRAVENATFLDFEALDWLYTTSPNRSVHRIIARCVAVHPIISGQFTDNILKNLWWALDISEKNVVDLRYGLCLDLLTYKRSWRLVLRSILNLEECQVGEAEFRSYSQIAGNVLNSNHDQIMKDAINDDFKLPLAMWCYFFERASPDATTVATHILTYGHHGLFAWKFDPTCKSVYNMGVMSLINEELGWWKFQYLFCYFSPGNPDYSSESKSCETRHLLLITIYRNLTSDQPLIADKAQRQEVLFHLFRDFYDWLKSSKPGHSSEQYLAFFKNIFCVDAFQSKFMKLARLPAVLCLESIGDSMDTDAARHLSFTECHDLTPIYQWCSRDDLGSGLSFYTIPMFTLLLMPQNRRHLCTILSRDHNAVIHLSKCFQNARNYCRSDISARTHMYQILMDLLKSVGPKVPLFTFLYNTSVLAQIWEFLVFQELDPKKFLLVVKSKLDREELNDFYATMTEQARSNKFPDIHHALEGSAHEFGQIIGVSHPRLESTAGESTPEGAADNLKDHDTEERSQVHSANESKGFRSMANWTTKVLGSAWSKTSVE